MIYLKETITKVKERFLSEKLLNELQNSFVFQLLVISQIKNYLYKSVTTEPIFLIPQPIKKKSSKTKKILVLDMDETLVYTRRQSKPTHNNYKSVDFNGSKMYIEERPLLREFLEAVGQIFDVFVYTAGHKKYADIVLDRIDQGKVIQRRFYRECCKKENGNFYKDIRHLKKVAKNRGEMILVDDNAVSIGRNHPYSVRIKEFEGDQTDRQLSKIFNSLIKFYM